MTTTTRLLLALVASTLDALAAELQTAKADQETRYLAFQIFTNYSTDPKDAPALNNGMRDPLTPGTAALRSYVLDIKQRIGIIGDRQTRLAIMLGPLCFDQTDAEITHFIERAFDLALETDMAVGFHIDDCILWSGRKDLWNDPRNVEALDWDGTPSTGRQLNYSKTPMEVAPQMCFNSKAIQHEVRQRAALIGKTIAAGVKKLEQLKRPEMFVGVTSGWETQMGSDLKTGKYLGYRALLNRGFSRAHPPQDQSLELEQVTQEFIALWTTGLAEAGVPQQKIYSHIAFLSHRAFGMGDNKQITYMKPDKGAAYSQHNHYTPPSVAFGEGHRPGFSTYPQPGLFADIYEEVARHNQVAWASSEGTNMQPGTGPGQTGMNMETYLAKMFNHGATVTTIFSWGIGGERMKNMNYRLCTEGEEELQAYRKFLKGEPLIEAKETMSLMERLPLKVHNIQAEFPAWMQKADPDKKAQAIALMQKLRQQAKGKDPDALEKTADAILKLMGVSAPPSAQVSENTPPPTPPSSPSSDDIQKRLTEKVQRAVQGAKQWTASGRDASNIRKTMAEKFKPLMDAGKVSEAEAVLDRVLEQLKPDGKGTELPAATPASSKAPATSEKPQYLIFWSSPEKAGELAERVGMKGDGKTRLLGFGLPNPTYELEEQLPSRIRSAFAAAREHDMAVMLHFDFHLHWKHRPDLWNWFDPDKPGYNLDNKSNVEWHGWDGPPNKVSYLNHGVLERMPPSMCFTSKRIRAEITRIVSRVIGPVLREELAKLKAEGKEALFAGVLVGLEPSIDDYSKTNPACMKMMKEGGVKEGPLGYRALLDRGFSADNPPRDFHRALAEIVQETVAFWCEQFVDAGISAEKLYPHVAAPAPIEVTNAPIWTAFNRYSRPGWTTYPVGIIGESFKPIYDELEKHGSPAWGGAEANAGYPGSAVDWETYLAWHYNHGCVLVGVNAGATGKDLPKRLSDSAFGKEAIGAYHKFLTGQPLVEKPFSLDHNPPLRIQVKMRRVRDGIQRWHSSGKDPSAVGKLMQGAQPLASSGKLVELEKLVDQALEMLGETEKVPDATKRD